MPWLSGPVARSRACCSVFTLSTPYTTGVEVWMPTDMRPDEVACEMYLYVRGGG